MITVRSLRAGMNLKAKAITACLYRRQAQDAWRFSDGRFAAYQGAEFARTYDFARRRVPYYRERPEAYPERPADPSAMRRFLECLPILTKSEVRDHNADMWASPLPRLTRFHTTSGTSGTPLRLAATVWERAAAHAALEEWFWRLTGSRSPRAIFLSGLMVPGSSDELFWQDPVGGHTYLSIYSLMPRHRRAIIGLIQRARPRLIYGYASAVRELALLIGDEAAETRDSRVAVVTSEVLQPQWRREIEASLCRRVYDLYGSQEGAHLALECGHGAMHVHPSAGIVELLDDSDRPVQPGEFGRVVVTTLSHRTMPLLRYDLGDLAELPAEGGPCGCGLHWPTIGRIEGRCEDLVRTRDGRRIGYLCFHATRGLPAVRECQLIQTGYERFVVNMVSASGRELPDAAAEALVRAEITGRLGLPVQLEFRYLGHIPRGPNGKFRAVVVDFT